MFFQFFTFYRAFFRALFSFKIILGGGANLKFEKSDTKNLLHSRVETEWLTCKNLQASYKTWLTCKNLQASYKRWLTRKNKSNGYFVSFSPNWRTHLKKAFKLDLILEICQLYYNWTKWQNKEASNKDYQVYRGLKFASSCKLTIRPRPGFTWLLTYFFS